MNEVQTADRLKKLGNFTVLFGLTKEIIKVTKPATPVSAEESVIEGYRVAVDIDVFDPKAGKDVGSRLQKITLQAEGKTIKDAQQTALSEALDLLGV